VSSVVCPACSAENEEGRKFCGECGGSLARACPACGTANGPAAKFCGECGASLVEAAVAPTVSSTPTAERRLVSVLFADLVGFTTLSESRDAEEVRELLSRYFDTCRRLIELYGGTVEKFIGDAVMAVWGTPVATEDDAERAVRAALDLVAAVSALGDEVGTPELRARAGVLTGEAAVTLGATDQGMVAGDLVNTAARIQTAAEAGSVYVGESTRRATEPTIVFEDAGSFELKGKEGLTPLWKALRVVSGARGALKSTGLEAPFVGRERELRQIKDLFHVAAAERRAQLVSITGIAGIGKSRLAWEFYKYFDGLPQLTYWHRGRCLAYGEGVTYWALADMVRMRCRITEDEEPASALGKLRATLEEHVPDEEERRFVEPRVAQLLGLVEHEAREKQDLFAAWRLFFERLADVYPTVLAFEDMQWADASLLDFVEYLLDWSRSSPIVVITLARPELLERRPTWGAGQRSFSSIYLEPLPADAMDGLLAGLVPGLPVDVRDRILDRAQGVPLYAVETVRMLLDRGLLVQDGPAYRLTGPVESLEVPETLHALIAARLDGLSTEERRLLQDAAVVGKTFTIGALAALGGSAEGIEQLLAGLARKEVLGVQADPRSPERGQYGFLQDLVRHVAYETLSRRERRSRHLAAAAYLSTAFAADEGEVIEVIASHYLAAHEAAPDADDAAEIKGKAQAALVRAGEHARSLAAAAEALRYFVQATELTQMPVERARLLWQAGVMAASAGDPDVARVHLNESIELYESEGDTHAAARVTARLARVDAFTGRRDEAMKRMQRAFEVTSGDAPDEDLALLAARLSLGYWYGGDLEHAAERAELALDIAEAHGYPTALPLALRAKAGIAASRGHIQEAGALTVRALEVALKGDVVEEAGTCYFWLSDQSFQRDDYARALVYLDETLALTRRAGDRAGESATLSERTWALFMLGRWDEVQATSDDFTDERWASGGLFLSLFESAVLVNLRRGLLDDARSVFSRLSRLDESTDNQDRSTFLAVRASLNGAEGRLREALADGEAAVEVARTFGIASQSSKHGLVEALEAAVALGDVDKAEELLGVIDAVPSGTRPPFLDAHAHRIRARLTGDDTGFRAAAEQFRSLGILFWLGVTQLEHAESLGAAGRADEAESLLAEARGVFGKLGATPWLARVEAEAGAGKAEVQA
jgi:class 3 adenylate cyclase/tetratricopeptide (TPR) repeat protein